jgi:hypothetical protein
MGSTYLGFHDPVAFYLTQIKPGKVDKAGSAMAVWAVFDGHRCLSVWTTEEAADAVRKRGQWVVEAALTPLRGAASAPIVAREDRSKVVKAAFSRLSARVTAY